MKFLPELLKLNDGTPVKTQEDWNVRRKELLDTILREQYGYPPAAPAEVIGEVIKVDKKCAAGHAQREEIRISFQAELGEFCFPLHFFAPVDGKKHPLILHINFRPDAYDMYAPVEEIIDNGFAFASFCYKDITSDDGDFSNGLAGLYTRPQGDDVWGKIALWAFAAQRALDYLTTREEVDAANIAVAGHSRLGKTTLLCGALDERVKFALANDSGCGGGALEQTKHEGGETIAHMNVRFLYWFCENRKKYEHTPMWDVFDQHFLVAACAPRFVALGSATQDFWADQYSEQLCAIAASPAWEVQGLKGFCGPEEPAKCGECYQQGHISYHLRDGIHFFSRQDWLRYMAFIKENL